MLKEGQLLSMEMRIFALIRLGVHDHEKNSKDSRLFADDHLHVQEGPDKKPKRTIQ